MSTYRMAMGNTSAPSRSEGQFCQTSTREGSHATGMGRLCRQRQQLVVHRRTWSSRLRSGSHMHFSEIACYLAWGRGYGDLFKETNVSQFEWNLLRSVESLTPGIEPRLSIFRLKMANEGFLFWETKPPKMGFQSASAFWNRSFKLGYWFVDVGVAPLIAVP